ncbi:MAG TPA: spore germination protein GerW family protein [Candidatus Ozemobacteraceae bacterium]|nr:spore germination protein GerW family protein [Candidatus Ozemobacteraceae bacterium]
MGIDTLVKTVLSELQVAVNSKTVVGEPITVQNWTVIPVTKVSFGFGVGGGDAKKETGGFGGGSGGGATIEPMAFIAVNPTEVKLISLKGKDTVWEKLLNVETVEKIYDKLMGFGDNGGVGTAAKDTPVATPEAKPASDPTKSVK